jgi:hypothetical protein
MLEAIALWQSHSYILGDFEFARQISAASRAGLALGKRTVSENLTEFQIT